MFVRLPVQRVAYLVKLVAYLVKLVAYLVKLVVYIPGHKRPELLSLTAADQVTQRTGEWSNYGMEIGCSIHAPKCYA